MEARWREFQTEECGSFGIRPMSSLAHWLRLPSGSLLRHSQPVVFRRAFTGMTQFSIREVRVGTMLLHLRFGTALSSELFPIWRSFSMSNTEAYRQEDRLCCRSRHIAPVIDALVWM